MSSKNKVSKTRGGRHSDASSSSSFHRGGRDPGRPPQRTGVKPHDFDSKRHNNPQIKVVLVFPKHPDLTMVCTPRTISAGRFICGTNHSSSHTAIKQAVCDSLINSLSQAHTIDEDVKGGVVQMVESCHADYMASLLVL